MLGSLGDEWTLLLVQQSLLGVTRYGEFIARLPISHSVLTGRLRAMTADDLLVPQRYQDNPPRSEYLLTPRGRALWPILTSIWAWESLWVADHAEDLPSMRHVTCGADFTPVLACRACGEVASEKDVRAQWGPSGSWVRSMPVESTRRRSASETDPAARRSGAGLFPETMSILGNRWGFALLVASFVGASRFTDYQGLLGAPPGSLTDRLQRFCANGVLASTDGRYVLTEKGRAAFPILITALQWGQRWFNSPEGPAVNLTHTPCHGPFHGALTCEQCAGALRGADVAMEG